MISYAQNSEDILLYRCFRDVAAGFYVDVGAFHPEIASVSKLFYDRGWSGINIEPGQGIAALQAARPRDVNLAVAISDHSGEANFYEHPNDPGTSTLLAEVPAVIAERTGDRQLRRVSLLTLTQVLDAHAPTRHLHFLKVDAEGAETAVIAGLDLKRYRPEVILIESTEPYSTIRRIEPWSDILATAGYRLAYFDGINDFWVREESAERLLPEFAVPVNVLDGFTQPDPRVKALKLSTRELPTPLGSMPNRQRAPWRCWQPQRSNRSRSTNRCRGPGRGRSRRGRGCSRRGPCGPEDGRGCSRRGPCGPEDGRGCEGRGGPRQVSGETVAFGRDPASRPRAACAAPGLPLARGIRFLASLLRRTLAVLPNGITGAPGLAELPSVPEPHRTASQPRRVSSKPTNPTL